MVNANISTDIISILIQNTIKSNLMWGIVREGEHTCKYDYFYKVNAKAEHLRECHNKGFGET